MKALLMKVKSLFSKENTLTVTVLIVLLHPILDLDHIFYSFLDRFNLPLPSTLLHFLVLPLFILMVYFILEPKKLKVGIGFGLYGLVVIGYFILHHLYVKDLFDQLYLTNRYVYSLSKEFQYVLTLIIPFGMIYAFFRVDLNEKVFNKIIVWTSILIAIPLFLSNLFLFGPSTYVGDTMANFPTWFFGIYDTFHPRQLATKFFFSEGNTTGILLFAIYPLLIKQYFEDRKHRYGLLVLIAIQGMAMYVLATRVATYGVPLMLGTMLAVYTFLVFIKKIRMDWKPFLILSSVFLVFITILPYTPAMVNQTIDAENNGYVFDNEDYRVTAKDYVKDGAKNLIPGSAEFNYYYIHIFKDYAYFLTIPKIYWEWYYPYTIDAKWYVDLIFNYDLSQRASGRQFEKIFSEYKWNQLSATQKLFGYSYTMFMNGSILLEQDFLMQRYSFGYLGLAILVGPWLVVSLLLLYVFLRKFNANLNLTVLSLGLSLVALFGGAYMSGHVIDQFLTTTYMALIFGFLFSFMVGRIESQNE